VVIVKYVKNLKTGILGFLMKQGC